MNFEIEERVGQVIRHLQYSEAKRIAKALSMLQHEGLEYFKDKIKLYKLDSGERLYIFRATPRLRILIKQLDEYTLLIEDIISRDVLEKFIRSRKR